MSNCVVGSVGLRLPGSIIAEHSVEGSDHFSHDGDDDDLGFLVGVGKTVGEGLESGIVSACAEGCHVEDITDRHPTTVDTSVSPELATVEVIWCETDEHGDLLAAHLPEFWQQGDERKGQHRARRLASRSAGHRAGAKAALVATISAKRLSRRRISASSRIRRRLLSRLSMASSRWAAWLSTATCSSHSCRRMVTISASLSTASSRCTTRVGMMATYSAISRASRRSFLARTLRARAN